MTTLEAQFGEEHRKTAKLEAQFGEERRKTAKLLGKLLKEHNRLILRELLNRGQEKLAGIKHRKLVSAEDYHKKTKDALAADHKELDPAILQMLRDYRSESVREAGNERAHPIISKDDVQEAIDEDSGASARKMALQKVLEYVFEEEILEFDALGFPVE